MTGAPSSVVTVMAPGVSTASSSSARAKTSRVRPIRAGMSEASRATPSCSPSTRGVERRAATMVSGSSACTTAMEKAPRTARSVRRVASVSEAAGRHVALDQVGQHLGVGGRGEGMAVGLEVDPELMVVLDDPVVDEGQAAGAVEVGVGVLGRGVPVGGPAGVADGRRVAGRGVGGAAGPGRPPTGCRRRPGPARSPRRPPGPPRPSRSPGTRGGAERRESGAARQARR